MFNENSEVMLSMSEKTINYQFKVLYTLGIIFVVTGHCYGGISLFLEWFPVYSFPLPLFASCSGYFFKSNEEGAPLSYIWRKFRRLIIPLYLWNFMYAGIASLLAFKGFKFGVGISFAMLITEPIMTGNQFVYNLGGWFVIPLFLIDVFNVIIRKLSRNVEGDKKEIILSLVYTIIGSFGIYMASIGYHTGGWLVLARTLYFLPFFGFGVLYKNVLERLDHLSNTTYFAVIFLIQLCIILVYGSVPVYASVWCANFINGLFVPILVGITGIAFWLRVSRLLEPAIGRSKIINTIADHSYAIMIRQIMGFIVVKTLYALISRFTPFFSDFDWVRYKTDIWYYYMPNNAAQSGIFYTIAGIAFRRYRISNSYCHCNKSDETIMVT